MAKQMKFNFNTGDIYDATFDKDTRVFHFFVDGTEHSVVIEPSNSPDRLENLEFEDGTVLSLADIAAALDLPDLATAAGPSAVLGSGGVYNDDAGELIGGIDRLGGLDTFYWGEDTEVTDRYIGAGFRGSSMGEIPGDTDGPTTITPPVIEQPEVEPPVVPPVEPDPDPEPENHVPTITSDSTTLSADEAGLKTGTKHDGSNSTSGSFAVNSPDGIDYLEVNGQVVHAGETITTPDGTFKVDSITPKDNGDYNIEFSYTLDHAVQHTDGTYPPEQFEVVVVDSDGDKSDPIEITVNIIDDGINANVTSESSFSTDYENSVHNEVITSESIIKDLNVKPGIDRDLGKSFEIDGVIISTGRVTHPNDDKNFVLDESTGGNLVMVNGANTPDDRTGFGINDFVSDGKTGHNSEVGYDKTTDTSEAIIFDLGGKLANSIEIDFRVFYLDGGHTYEKVSVALYLHGELVGIREIQGKGLYNVPGGGQQLGTIDLQDGVFDKVVIFAKDDGSRTTDNSDFYVKDIKFDYNETIVTYTGHGSFVTDTVGADGLDSASLGFAAIQTLPESLTGYTIDSGITFAKIYQPDGTLAFEVILDPSTGNWTYNQYQPLPEGFNDDLEFKVIGKDMDGDEFDVTVSTSYQTSDGAVHYSPQDITNPDYDPSLYTNIAAHGHVVNTEALAAQYGIEGKSGWEVIEAIQNEHGWGNQDVIKFVNGHNDTVVKELVTEHTNSDNTILNTEPGEDLFVFTGDYLAGGHHSVIHNFNPEEDKIKFEDMFENTKPELNDILGALGDGRLGFEVKDADTALLKVSNSTIEINFSNDALSTFVDTPNYADLDAERAQFLLQVMTTQ